MDILVNEEKKANKKKNMKIIKITIVILILLLIAIIGSLIGIYYMKSKEFKVIIDGTNNTSLSASSDSFIIDGDKVYVALKDISTYLGDYKYNNGEYGEYKQYSEDKTSCYLKNDYEVVTYSMNSSTIYKKVLAETSTEVEKASSTITSTSSTKTSSSTDDDTDTDYEYFTIDKPVFMKNDKLYTTLEGLSIGCNVTANYNSSTNTITIYTLSKLTSYYTNKFQQSAISDDTALFSNKKALLYDLIIVKDDKGKYGVYNLNNEEVIGEKYASIKFMEASQEFIVKTDENKMGIISKDGTTKIKPEYDIIKQINSDTDNELYLVSNNSKYGVVNKNGKAIIYLEYEAIGVDSSKFTSDNIKNKYILYDNCIPVEKGTKWGLLDIKGNTIMEPKYDGFGCVIGTSNSKAENNLLLIPEYEGIVVMQDKYYGIINSSGKELIPPAVTDIYSITSSGKNDYYLTYNKQTIDVLNYLENTLGLSPVDKTINNAQTNSEVNNSTENSNTNNGEVTENTIITEPQNLVNN